jgi:hypothetical protein
MKLTRDKADALCTIITFGFFYTEGNRIIIQPEYSEWDDEEEYKLVLDMYSNISGDATLVQDEALLQEILPYVLAKNPGDAEGIQAQTGLTAVSDFIHELFLRVQQREPDAPHGAYIGGKYDGQNLSIVGPSVMAQYPPVYRSIIGEEVSIKEAFNKSKASSSTSWECIQEVNPFPNLELTPRDEAFNNDEPYRNGLFKCCHGMIQAMSDYPPNNNNVIFEIALGRNTTKVGACIPCSIFMFANGRLPSSVHLGRGDNWNIPDEYPFPLITAWKNRVTDYFNAGMMLFNANPNQFDNIRCLNCYLDSLNNNFSIPDIFLEALTFESKFTDKIKNTLVD